MLQSLLAHTAARRQSLKTFLLALGLGLFAATLLSKGLMGLLLLALSPLALFLMPLWMGVWAAALLEVVPLAFFLLWKGERESAQQLEPPLRCSPGDWAVIAVLAVSTTSPAFWMFQVLPADRNFFNPVAGAACFGVLGVLQLLDAQGSARTRLPGWGCLLLATGCLLASVLLGPFLQR